MLASLLVVILVEAAHQVLEDGPHGVVVQPGVPHRVVGVQDRFGAEVDLWSEEPVYDSAQYVAVRELPYLVAKLELVQDVLDIGGEAVQVGVEVVPELLLCCPGRQIPELEGGRVVEGHARRLL